MTDSPIPMVVAPADDNDNDCVGNGTSPSATFRSYLPPVVEAFWNACWANTVPYRVGSVTARPCHAQSIETTIIPDALHRMHRRPQDLLASLDDMPSFWTLWDDDSEGLGVRGLRLRLALGRLPCLPCVCVGCPANEKAVAPDPASSAEAEAMGDRLALGWGGRAISWPGAGFNGRGAVSLA